MGEEELKWRQTTSLKKCFIMIIIMMNKSPETTVFVGRQKLTSVMKLKPLVMVDFIFDALYR